MVSIASTKRAESVGSKLFNVVFGMPERELFTADDVAKELADRDCELPPRLIEAQLRRWSDMGKLSRMSRYYTIAR